MRIYEEGLTFGEYNDADCFHIEETDIYKRLAGKGFKSVEFLLHQPEKGRLMLVEGKNTLPAKKNVSSFDEELYDISRKFMDSLQLACGIWFGGYNEKVIVPKNGPSFFIYGNQIVFVLVIKNRRGNLLHIADRIRQHLTREHRLWKFEILVLNEQEAIKNNLIIAEESA